MYILLIHSGKQTKVFLHGESGLDHYYCFATAYTKTQNTTLPDSKGSEDGAVVLSITKHNQESQEKSRDQWL